MDHHLRARLFHPDPNGLFTSPIDLARYRSKSTAVQVLGFLFLVFSAPFALTLIIVLLTVPNEGLDAGRNTAYWALSSVALGLAIVAGVVLLVWLARFAQSFVGALHRESLERCQPELLIEITESLAWMDDIPVADGPEVHGAIKT